MGIIYVTVDCPMVSWLEAENCFKLSRFNRSYTRIKTETVETHKMQYLNR